MLEILKALVPTEYHYSHIAFMHYIKVLPFKMHNVSCPSESQYKVQILKAVTGLHFVVHKNYASHVSFMDFKALSILTAPMFQKEKISDSSQDFLLDLRF